MRLRAGLRAGLQTSSCTTGCRVLGEPVDWANQGSGTRLKLAGVMYERGARGRPGSGSEGTGDE